MTTLATRVKNALDEARMLVLGAQVLVGFQYRSFFEPGYEQLQGTDRVFELMALALLLATLALLFLAPARHRIAERGHDSEEFHRFAMLLMKLALLPFALGLGLALGVAADLAAGPVARWLFAAGGSGTAALAWYGHFLHPDRKPKPPQEGGPDERSKEPMQSRSRSDGDEDERLNRHIQEALTECRVVLPGAQALLGFQLAITLTEAFPKLPEASRVVHLLSLGLVAASTIVLIAPAAYHRIVESGQESQRLLRFSSNMIILALSLLAPGLCGDLYVVLRRAGYEEAALPGAAGALLVFAGLWFGYTLWVRRTRRPPGGSPLP